MASLPVTFSDLEGHFCCLISNLNTSEIHHVLSTICLHINRKAHVAFNFK